MQRAVSVSIVVLALAVASAAPAMGSGGRGKVAIGDSVMLGAAAQLRAHDIRVDAVVSRQFGDAIPIVRRMKRDGRLPRTVIVHLGTNGIAIDPEACDRLARAVGRERRLFLVTIKIDRGYRRPQNARLAQCAHRLRNTILIDWYALSHDHPSWFYADGYHLRPIGRVRYAALLDRGSTVRAQATPSERRSS